MPRRPRPSLTPKRRAFIDEYLIDFNATQAAIRAGYKEKSAHTVGSRMLGMPPVKAALEAAIAARAERTRATADRVIAEYARLAFADMRRYVEWGPDGVKLRPHWELSADDAAAVVEIVPVGAEGKARIKLYDKRPALDALARHLGLFDSRWPGQERVPYGSDIRTAAQTRARAALKERIEKIIKEREEQETTPAAPSADQTAERA
jgi:phage terminase small subunit